MSGLLEIINPISLIMHLVNLVILYVLFKIFLYKPLTKFMKKRTERFEQERGQINEDRAQVDALMAQGDGILHAARSDADAQVAQIMTQAQMDAQSIRQEAAKQAEVIIETAKQTALDEKKRQLDSLHDQVMELSVALASRILGREIKPEDHQKLMEEFLTEVK